MSIIPKFVTVVLDKWKEIRMISRLNRYFALAAKYVMSMALIILLLGLSSIDAYGSELVTRSIDSGEIAKNMIGTSAVRRFQVYLPDGYDEGSGMYPVLYWIPGWGTGLSGFTYKSALDDAIEDGNIPATIVVFIDVHEGVWFLDSPVMGNWESFMILELIPFIEREYRTISHPWARGLMGHSAGGYTAFMLPVRHPDIWGAVGMNDPALWGMWAYIRDESVFIPGSFPPYADVMSGYRNPPKELNGYIGANMYSQDLIQLGTAFSPNPDEPLFCSLPKNPEGEWVPEVREKWIEYGLSNPDVLAKHSDTLKSLLSIVIILPQGAGLRIGNTDFIKRLEAAGVSVTSLDMPGGHGDNYADRFIALAAMEGSGTSVSPRGKLAALWGSIRQAR